MEKDVTNLEEARRVIRQLQEKVRNQSSQFLACHRRFKVQEELFSRIIKDRNDQLGALSAKLLVFEAKLLRKQRDISLVLSQRDSIINKQQQVIKTLQTRLQEAGLEYNKDSLIVIDCPGNDSDSAVIMEDDDCSSYYRSSDSSAYASSISDIVEPVCKPTRTARNGYHKRSQYNCEDDEFKMRNSSEEIHGRRKSEKLSDIDETEHQPPNQVTTYNRVMSNHRSVTKPKDVKYKRINKAKSKSLEELRGKLKSWVEKSNKFSFSSDHFS